LPRTQFVDPVGHVDGGVEGDREDPGCHDSVVFSVRYTIRVEPASASTMPASWNPVGAAPKNSSDRTIVSTGASALVTGATIDALPRLIAITRNSAPTALSSWVPAVSAGACHGNPSGSPPIISTATGISSSP